MKIRIKGNSIRYRLTRSDLNLLEENGFVQEHIDFGQRLLMYVVKAADDAESLSIGFIDDTITLLIPRKMVQEMMSTNRVGFDREDGGLMMLIEKDFKCLDEVNEDQSDQFPNPAAKKTA